MGEHSRPLVERYPAAVELLCIARPALKVARDRFPDQASAEAAARAQAYATTMIPKNRQRAVEALTAAQPRPRPAPGSPARG